MRPAWRLDVWPATLDGCDCGVRVLGAPFHAGLEVSAHGPAAARFEVALGRVEILRVRPEAATLVRVLARHAPILP
jgi:hypothetical protein